MKIRAGTDDRLRSAHVVTLSSLKGLNCTGMIPVYGQLQVMQGQLSNYYPSFFYAVGCC